MTERSVTHATWTVERTYSASATRVFAAFAEKEQKARWFGGEDDASWEQVHWDLDFRVGGRERNEGRMKDGSAYTLESVYRDIVPDERIVYSYDMSFRRRAYLRLALDDPARAGGRRHEAHLYRAGRLPRRARHARAARGGHRPAPRRAGGVAGRSARQRVTPVVAIVARAVGEVGAPSRPSGASLASSRLSAPEGRAAPRPRELTRAPAAASMSGPGVGSRRPEPVARRSPWEVAIGVPVPEIVSAADARAGGRALTQRSLRLRRRRARGSA